MSNKSNNKSNNKKNNKKIITRDEVGSEIDQCIKCKYYRRINGETYCTNKKQIRGDRRIIHDTSKIQEWCDEWE